MHKTNKTLSSVARNTSCSHGWLRVFVQSIFGLIIVTSFILIVLMSMGFTKFGSSPHRDSSCHILGCRVVCDEVPYFGQYEEDILYTVSEADPNCDRVLLTLNSPLFRNGSLPPEWLTRVRANVEELEIVGGNLKSIAAGAFVTPFGSNIRRLAFEKVHLIKWESETLVGLSQLQELSIKDSHILRIYRNALEAVDDTLVTLSITDSGFWDPRNLTGQANPSKLANVIFSVNNFNNILNRRSFDRLRNTKHLFLNSCRISAIGHGAFDNLASIETLYLNNNFLVVFPSGLFDTIVSITDHRPRIHLHNNLWYCACYNAELRRLTTKDLLLIDPVCYYPHELRDITFKDVEKKCGSGFNETLLNDVDVSLINENRASSYNLGSYHAHIDMVCNYGDRGQNTLRVINPIKILECPISTFKNEDLIFNGSKRKRPPNHNEIIKTTFAMKSDEYSILEIASSSSNLYGLMWYQSKCPQDVYCISLIPSYLRLYNFNDSAEYLFCPLKLDSGIILNNKCVFYSFETNYEAKVTTLRVILYCGTIVFCFIISALCVYAIIRKFPYLLRGSNRILFVKHKNVNALILPPKVPLRATLSDVDTPVEFNKDVFMLSGNNKFSKGSFLRTKSVRSNKSFAPSYISALQPTEEQLTEWRLRHHFDNNLTITSVTADFPYSLFSDDTPTYSSLGQTSYKTYDSLNLNNTQ